jgi:myo-inositol-1(or 4)-monophosphatase
MTHTPYSILETLHPILLDSARYAQLLQSRIHSVEEKEGATNIFAAALSDADLSVQAAVELVLLARFPTIPFFGEEWKSSRNTKYLAGTHFVEGCELLITLDPIDGTRPYLDGHAHYQIILTVVTRDGFEAVMVVFPSFGDYVYALRGKGAFRGSFDTPLDKAERWEKGTLPHEIFLSAEYEDLVEPLSRSFKEVHTSAGYSRDRECPYLSATLRRKLCGGMIPFSQVIDGAALAFVAAEMGFTVTSLDGGPLARPADYEDLILPGVIVGGSEEVVETLRRALAERR